MLATAAEESLDALRDGRVEQEPALTDRMLGYMERAIQSHRGKGLVWRAKTFTDRGKGAQESLVGADFMGVLEIAVSGFSVKKGFLAQAKLIRAGATLSPKEHSRLRDQCRRMLRISPASFIFVYSDEGIYVVPAVSAAAASRENFANLYTRSIGRFYEEHFASFIGDERLSAPRIDVIHTIAREHGFHAALGISAKEERSK